MGETQVSDDSKPRSYNFITDEPAAADKFSSHSRVAKALAAAIRDQPRLKVIGLLGRWGSGKSTVIRLVEEELTRPSAIPESFVFTYDAWLHQSDPPRRAFLENLIKYIKSLPILAQDANISADDWKSKIDVLNRQVEESETTTTPNLTPTGSVFVGSLIGIPIGVKLIGDGWINRNYLDVFQVWPVSIFWLGWILVSGPAIVLLFTYLSWRNWELLGQPGFLSKHREPFSDRSILALVANKHVEKKTDRKSKGPDPSAIEFQEILKEIFRTIGKPNRRFVIVVDNLDRLPPADGVAMWATIRSMFLGSPTSVFDGSVPVIILPVDQGAIVQMYGKDKSDPVSLELAKSFVDKTFDITFHVPPPVLSNWNRYLSDQLSSVFSSSIDDEMRYAASSIYEHYIINKNTPITPRNINSYVNSLAVLWMQWESEGVSFAAAAAYASDQAFIDENILITVSNDRPEISRFDREWQKSVAAMHYGVPIADAYQIMLDQPLRSALAKSEYDSFEQLSLVPGFQRYLDRILNEALGGQNLFSAPSVALMLDAQNVPEKVWARDIWTKLREIALSANSPVILSPESLRGYEALIHSCDAENLRAFVHGFSKSLGRVSDEEIEKDHGAIFVQAVRLAVRHASAAGFELDPVIIPGSARSNCFVLSTDQAEDLAGVLEAGISINELVAYLAVASRDPGESTYFDRFLTAIAAKYGTLADWQPLIALARQTVIDGNFDNMSAALNTLGTLHGVSDAARAATAEMTSGGLLVARMGEAQDRGAISPLARCIALLISAGTPLELVNGQAWETTLGQHGELIELVDGALSDFGSPLDIELIVRAGEMRPDALPLVRGLVERRLKLDRLQLPASADVLARQQAFMNALTPEARSAFWDRVAQSEGFWDHLEAQPFGAVSGILHAILDGTASQRKGITFVIEAAEHLSQTQWTDVVTSGVEPRDLLRVAFDASKRPPAIGGQLSESLRSMIPAVIATGDLELRHRWFELSQWLAKGPRTTLYRTLADAVTSGQQASDLLGLLRSGGADLLVIGEFGKKGDAAVRHLVQPLLTSPEGVDTGVKLPRTAV